ncbi:MAG TPA: aminopeptidase [Desulfobacteraceae bacterium]|nr:aminopeptidase [Desulfobacteraceae bacterium]
MLSEKYLGRYADVLIWGLKTARSGRFKKGDIVVLRGDPAAMALVEKVYGRVLELGMNAVVRIGGTPAMEQMFYEKTNSRQLKFIAPGEDVLNNAVNGSVYFHAPASLTHLAGVDPVRIAKAAVARKPLRDIIMRREEQGVFGWTLCAVPTECQARHAGLTLEEYERQVMRACYLDASDPVAEWKEVYRRAGEIKRWLNKIEVKTYHVESEHCDLTVAPGERRKWIGISGHNIPSFELFLSPDRRSVSGVYYADQPSFRSGNLVEGVRLEFNKGVVAKLEAATGEKFAESQISMDKGARRVGEFSLTDIRFSRIDKFMANTLYDENFGGRHGNCHIALGASYSDTYDGNPSELTAAKKKALGFNDSALHWDLVNTEKKTVTAVLKDGSRKIIYEDGKFAR